MNVRGSQSQVNIGSGNGLVLSGNKPLPQPMLTKIYDTIYDVSRLQWVKSSCFYKLGYLMEYILMANILLMPQCKITHPGFQQTSLEKFQWLSVFKIRSETSRTEAQFCQNLYIYLYMIKKESLPDRPKFCRSMSAVRHLFWRLDYSMIFQDKNSQISMIILNVTKRKITGPHVTHGLLTHLMFIIGCF